MPASEQHEVDGPESARRFASTRWSVVLAAGDSSAPGASEALEKLCGAYWFPLYAYVRRQGHSPHDAQDLTQGFFAWLIESKHLRVADVERGRFRSFLLGMLKNFLSDDRKKMHAQKRGGGRTPVSLDAASAEERYHLEPVTELTPDLIFDRRWAWTVMEQTVAHLRDEYVAAGRAELFDALRQFQPGEDAGQSYAEVATRLGLTESAVKSAIWRLRQRHRDLLREEIAHTVATPADVDGEIRHLLSVLSG
jgi:DNA-directed RNA polymerase specialized sigma24 family protein